MARDLLAAGHLFDPKCKDNRPCLLVKVEGLCPVALADQLAKHSRGDLMPTKLERAGAAAALAALDRDAIYQDRDLSEKKRDAMTVEYRAAKAAKTHVSFTWQILIARPDDWRAPADPHSLDRADLERFTELDFRTIVLYRLGGLADTGALRPIVSKPTSTGDRVKDMAAYAAWRFRYPINDNDRDQNQPALSAEALAPEVAEQMIADAERWFSKHESSAPLPPSVLRIAFYAVAGYFDAIRREWIAGDQKQLRILASGCGSETSGYAALMQQARAEVSWRWGKLQADPDLLPCVLPYCDPSLRDSIQRMIRLTDMDSTQPDGEGESSERWRQTWSAMDLDGEMDELIPKLRAAGDAALLPKAPAIDPAVVTEIQASRAAIERVAEEFKSWDARDDGGRHAKLPALSGGVALTSDHESILAVLGKTPTKRKTVIDVASAGTIRNRETVGRLLSELEEAGLVDRLYGKRKGYALTDAGRKRLPGASLT
ncbi:MAG: hypothetical protein IT432_15065 [Phycisphaerales bacterium]|nr:hypothetical protein [Phycisphaerales bacterium]